MDILQLELLIDCILKSFKNNAIIAKLLTCLFYLSYIIESNPILPSLVSPAESHVRTSRSFTNSRVQFSISNPQRNEVRPTSRLKGFPSREPLSRSTMKLTGTVPFVPGQLVIHNLE